MKQLNLILEKDVKATNPCFPTIYLVMCGGGLPATTGMQAEMGGQDMGALKGILALNGEVPIKRPQVSFPLWCQIGEPGMGYFWCVHSGLSRKQARLTGCLEYLGVVGWSCSGSHGISQKATRECGGGRQGFPKTGSIQLLACCVAKSLQFPNSTVRKCRQGRSFLNFHESTILQSYCGTQGQAQICYLFRFEHQSPSPGHLVTSLAWATLDQLVTGGRSQVLP